MISSLVQLPILKRLIPSFLIRFLKYIGKNRGFFRVRDIYMFLDFLDPIDRQIILNQNYEVEEFKIFDDLIKKNLSDYFIDIGANCGYYSFFILKNNPKIEVLAYEPNDEAYFKFLQTLKKNKTLEKNIKLFNYGLSNTNSKKTLYTKVKFGYIQTGGSSVESEHNANAVATQIAIFKITDEILDLKNKNIAIKIDVENHELKTLRGMSNLLSRNNIVLQIEIFENNFFEVNDFLENLDFKLLKSFKEKSIFYYTNNKLA